MNQLKKIAEIWSYIKTRKKYWLAPIILLLIIIGSVIVLSEGSAIAPFIYAIF